MVGLAADRPAKLGTVLARSLGVGLFVAAVGAPLVDSVSSLPHPAHPGRGVRWGRPGLAARPKAAVPVRQDRCSTVGTPRRRAFESGRCAPQTAFTAIPPLSQGYNTLQAL